MRRVETTLSGILEVRHDLQATVPVIAILTPVVLAHFGLVPK